MMKNDDWKTLSIARNKSQEFNTEMKNKFSENDVDSNSSPFAIKTVPK
jgi:hypothetical protein